MRLADLSNKRIHIHYDEVLEESDTIDIMDLIDDRVGPNYEFTEEELIEFINNEIPLEEMFNDRKTITIE